MAALQTVELKIRGMDCAECTQHVKHALQSVAGVEKADVLLAAEKAIVRLDPSKARSDLLMKAVEKAGYSIVDPRADGIRTAKNTGKRAITVLALVSGVVLSVVVLGEWLGLISKLTKKSPFISGRSSC